MVVVNTKKCNELLKEIEIKWNLSPKDRGQKVPHSLDLAPIKKQEI